MPRLDIISLKECFVNAMLEDLKKYASVPDDSQDYMLNRVLRNAVIRVSEYADRAVLPMRVRVTSPVPQSGIVRLYFGGGAIVEVKNAHGEDIGYDVLSGGRLQLFARGGEVTVVYDVEPIEGDRVRLSQTILRYATADYDGAETAELNNILTEAVR